MEWGERDSGENWGSGERVTGNGSEGHSGNGVERDRRERELCGSVWKERKGIEWEKIVVNKGRLVITLKMFRNFPPPFLHSSLSSVGDH